MQVYTYRLSSLLLCMYVRICEQKYYVRSMLYMYVRMYVYVCTYVHTYEHRVMECMTSTCVHVVMNVVSIQSVHTAGDSTIIW